MDEWPKRHADKKKLDINHWSGVNVPAMGLFEDEYKLWSRLFLRLAIDKQWEKRNKPQDYLN